jgi:hypothetical protein
MPDSTGKYDLEFSVGPRSLIEGVTIPHPAHQFTLDYLHKKSENSGAVLQKDHQRPWYNQKWIHNIQ